MSERRATAWSEDTPRPARAEHIGLPRGEASPRGLRLVTLAIDPRVGREVALWIVGPRAELEPVVAHPDFMLWPRPFLVGTPLGPLLEVLWTVPDPAAPTWPLWSFRTRVDPHGAGGLAAWEELARQSHVHVLVSEPEGAVIRWIERECPFVMDLLTPYLERARALPEGSIEEAVAQAELLVAREEMLLWDEDRIGQGVTLGSEEDLLLPGAEGRLALQVHGDLAAGRHAALAAGARDLRAQFGDDTVDRWFAHVARRLPGDEAEVLAALWGMADRLT
ncbi:MAG: hypothetical protein IT385_08005 [Deltaproteobacteria bacterium]|nr:hypothetical protein [Deltaproteobacteria bacterium]